MYGLFQSIQEIKQFIGGAANVSLDIDSVGPIVATVARKHLYNWISEAQYQNLVNNLSNLSTEQAALLPYVQRPLAMLTMYEYSYIGTIQFGESGMYRIEGDHEKSAFKYQENDYRRFMLEHGYEEIETLLKFLEANEANYPIWQASTAYQRNKALFINYVSDFREVYSLYINRNTFELLRPIIEDIETFAILPLLGQAQFDLLKDGILLKALTSIEQTLIKVIQKAVANFTIEEGLKRHWVLLDGQNVVQNEKLEPQSSIRQSSPSGQAFDLTVRHQEEWGNRHISQIKHFLDSNLAQFPEYQAYVTSLVETESTESADNSEDICLERKNCKTNCAYKRKTPKGVVRL